MQVDMHSKFSDQTDSNQTFPIQPRKVKRWLKDLPLVNIGETTRQFYHGLRALNRQQIAAKQRLEILEAMRPTGAIILANLHKHLVSRSLPLPPKSFRIVQLQQSLLSEMVAGYKIIVAEIANAEVRLDRKSTALVTHRALRYLGKRLLESYQIYAPTPQGVWQAINELYLFAEKRALLDRTVKDVEYHGKNNSNILDAFKQISLVALARPTSLRQGEVERLTVYLENACHYCTIADSPTEDEAGNVYYINTNLDNPPQFAIKTDIAISSSNRYLNPGVLIDRLGKEIRTRNPNQAKVMVTASALSMDLTERVLRALTSNPKRRSTRIEKNTPVTVAIGISDIHRAINAEMQNLWSEEQVLASPAEFMLMLMPKEEDSDYIIPPELDMAGSSYAWDMVAKGNLVTDPLMQAAKKDFINNDNVKPSQTDLQTWKILDSSAGGYHLFWEGTQSSKAQVGELLALRETHNNQHHWRLGMIRWMQYHTDKGLDVGIKMLSPKTLIASVESENKASSRSRQNTEDKTLALMLPPVAIINQPQSLVVPAGRFKEDDELVVKLLNGKSIVKLTGMSEHSGAFNQFHYLEVAKDNIENKPHEFESLWSSL